MDARLVAAGAMIALVVVGALVIGSGALRATGLATADAVSMTTFVDFPISRPSVLTPPQVVEAAPQQVARVGPRPTAPPPLQPEAPAAHPPEAPAPPAAGGPPVKPGLFETPAPPPAQQDPPALRRLIDAAERGDPAAAIVMIEDFRNTQRNAFAARLDELTEQALDRLWWQRIGELVQERQRVMVQINRLRQEQARATNPQRQQAITAEMRSWQAEADGYTRELQDMRYTASSAPDIKNAPALQRLRQQRDPMAYARWRNTTLASIIRTRGLPPWMAR